MRLMSLIWVLAAGVLTCAAQTNSDLDLTKYDAGTTNGLGSIPGLTNNPASTRMISLQDCLQMALGHNLDLQINRYNPAIALYALNAAYAGYDPSLFLSGEHDHSQTGARYNPNTGLVAGSETEGNSYNGSLSGLLPLGTTYSLQANGVNTFGNTTVSNLAFPVKNGYAATSIQLDQPLLKNFWIDSTRLNIRVAKNRLKYTELGLQQQIMQTATQVEQAYADLIYNRENVLVQAKAVELADRLVAENRKRLEVGTLAPLDLQSAESQAASSRAAMIAAKSQLDTQERALKALLTDDFSKWQATTLVPSGILEANKQPLNVQDSWSKGLTQRPDYLQAKLDVERAGIQLKYDKNQLFPQLDAFGSYGFNGTGETLNDSLSVIGNRDQPFYTAGAKITVPLSNIAARNAYKSGKAVMQQVVLQLKKIEQAIMITIDNDIGTVQANYDQVQATRAAREYAEAALAAEQLKLENGKSTTYTVLQMQRDLTTASGNEIQALDVYNKSLSQLSLDEGSTLERLGINLETR